MSKFLDFFDPIVKGNFGLTDEAIYKSIQMEKNFIPIWGGNKEHTIVEKMVSIKAKTKAGKQITVFDGEGIIISLDGSAGCMTYKINQKFALNHHAGFFKTKKDTKHKIIPEFFVLFYNNVLASKSVSDGSKTLSLGQLYSMDFEIPNIKIQKKVMKKIKPLLKMKTKIIDIQKKINQIKNKTITAQYKKYQATNLPIKNVIGYLSGNSGLTEQFIYQNSQNNKNTFTVLSGTIDKAKQLGKISLCEIKGKKLKVFKNKEGLLVIRKGKAGTTKYLEKGNYTLTDDAYLLYVKQNIPYEINLKWLKTQYRKDFLDYSSNSDNGTWHMTGFFNNVLIDIPFYSEQIKIVKKYAEIENYRQKLDSLLNKINSIFERDIV